MWERIVKKFKVNMSSLKGNDSAPHIKEFNSKEKRLSIILVDVTCQRPLFTIPSIPFG